MMTLSDDTVNAFHIVPLNTLAGRVTSSDPDVSQLRVAAAPGSVSTFGNAVSDALRSSHGLSYALPHLTEQGTIVSYLAAALALAISALLGIVAGLGPANQAADLDPAEALRYE